MRKTANREKIEGYLYDHDLKVKTVKNEKSAHFGQPFIQGSVSIATDETATNVVSVYYKYISPFTKDNKANKTYECLNSIIENNNSVISVGIENATMLVASTGIGVNDFVSKDGKMISAARHEGGFLKEVHSLNEDLNQRSTFEEDMLITSIKEIESDESRGIDHDYCQLAGYVFDYYKSLIPVTFNVHIEGYMDYFRSLDISKANPVFTKLKGVIENRIYKVEIEEPAAFGPPLIKYVNKTSKEWVVTFASAENYMIDDPDEGITREEIENGLKNREVHLAEVKADNEAYKNSIKNQPAAPAPVVNIPNNITVSSREAAASQFDF